MKLAFASLLILSTICVQAQIAFSEIQQEAGISDQQLNYGCYLGDYNNDGFDDIFITRRSGESGNSLYENNGNGSFRDVSDILDEESKHSSTAIWFDYNNDGWQDLMIANNVQEGHVLLRNNRDNSFSDVTEIAGVGGIKKESKSVNAADLNGDGWLDLYLNNFGEDNELYLNNQDGTFTESVKLAGVNHKGRAMGVVIFDYDNDVDQDIFLTFDGQPFVLYENNGSAQFIDVSLRTKTNLTGFGMGTDIADINGDGFMDLYVTNLFENFLILSNGDLTYTENGIESGVADLGMGWGCNFVDVNNDGQLDIYVMNEYGFSPENNVLYINNGNQTFQSFNQTSIESPYSGFGTSISDFNLDGNQDIFLANSNYVQQILLNQSAPNNWIKIKLLDTEENWHAVSAKVKITTKEGDQLDQLTAGSGHASQSTNIFHFGLGTSTGVTNIKITWPDGTQQSVDQLDANEMYLIIKNENPVIFQQVSYLAHFSTTPLTSSLSESIKERHQIQVYPNPVRDYLYTSASTDRLIIVNNAGKKAILAPVNAKKSIFDVSSLAQGVYYINTNNTWEKIFIQR